MAARGDHGSPSDCFSTKIGSRSQLHGRSRDAIGYAVDRSLWTATDSERSQRSHLHSPERKVAERPLPSDTALDIVATSSIRFTGHRDLYINALIALDGDRWRHNDDDRPKEHRHDDWLWRIADHRGMTHATFDQQFNSIYQRGWFSEADVGRTVRMGQSYILILDTTRSRIHISQPPGGRAILGRPA